MSLRPARILWAAAAALALLVGSPGRAAAAAAAPASVPVEVLRAEAGALRQAAQAWNGPLGEVREVRVAAARRLRETRRRLVAEGFGDDTTLAYLDTAAEGIGSADQVRTVGRMVRAVASRLETIAAVGEAGETRPAPIADAAVVRAALEDELASGRYGGEADTGIRQWLALLGRTVSEWLSQFISDDALSTLSRVSYYLMIALFVAGLVGLGWWYAGRRGRRQGREAVASPPEHIGTKLMADPATYHRDAEAHAAAGRYRDAVRALFLMALAQLEDRGLVAYDRTRTNREYLAQLARRRTEARLVEAFRGVTDVYDHVWYGLETCSSDDYASFARDVDATVALTREAA